MVPNVEFHIFTIHFEPPKRGQPLYKGQNVWSKSVLQWRIIIIINLKGSQ